MLSLFNRQDGDTIVEVLISIAVVGAVLTGAMGSANRSLMGSRQSQERTEAVKYTESQIEYLKSYVASNTPPGSGSFCLSGDKKSTKSWTVNSSKDTDDFLAYDTMCEQGVGVKYYSAITTTNGTEFSATTRWDNVRGNGRDEIKIIYRVYQ